MNREDYRHIVDHTPDPQRPEISNFKEESKAFTAFGKDKEQRKADYWQNLDINAANDRIRYQRE